MHDLDRSKIVRRLNRIEGQVRGVGRMLDDKRSSFDIVTQLLAVRAALARVETEVMKGQIGCFIESAVGGGDEREQRNKANELILLLELIRRS